MDFDKEEWANDIAVIRECVKNYGMIIVDECHHVPAFTFDQILKKANARSVYGLTATPGRPDGHHPIIFFFPAGLFGIRWTQKSRRKNGLLIIV